MFYCNMGNIYTSNGFCLSLKDENNWWITGDCDNKELVSKLATIMRLEECVPKDSFRIIFSSDDSKVIKGNSHPDINVSKSLPEWKLYEFGEIRIWCHNSRNEVICKSANRSDDLVQYISMWLSLLPIFQRSIFLGGLPLHAGLAELDGKGVLLAAPGNTGKSTCCRRLPDHWKPLCDDLTLVVRDEHKKYHVHPFPTWSDYLLKREENSWDVQYSVPLSAIFFIEQAESSKAIPLDIGKSAVNITDSSFQVLSNFFKIMSWEEQLTLKKGIFSNAYEIAKNIPAFRLHVSFNGRFWEEMEKSLVYKLYT